MCFVKGFTLLELLFALALSAIIIIGISPLYFSLNQLSKRQQVISDFAENARFLADFLRNKINQAGDWSCSTRFPGSLSKPIKGFDSDDAKNKLGLAIKPGTDVLQLHECVRLHDKMQYLPIEFFIADTYRVSALHHRLYALFYKVAHHPREELITGMSQFQLTFGVRDRSQKNIRAYHRSDSIANWQHVGVVKIRYTLVDIDSSLHQMGVLYAGLWHQAK